MNRHSIIIVASVVGVLLLVVAVFYFYWKGSPPPHNEQSVVASDVTNVEQVAPAPKPSSITTPLATSSSDQIQTQPNSNNWKRYTNKSGAYQITYPPSATVNESMPAEVRFYFQQPVDTGVNQALEGFDFEIRVMDNPQDLTPEEWVNAKATDVKDEGKLEIIVSGRMGYRVSIFGYDRAITQTYVAAAEKMYRISYWDPGTMFDFPDATREMYKNSFDRMVHSFKLL